MSCTRATKQPTTSSSASQATRYRREGGRERGKGLGVCYTHNHTVPQTRVHTQPHSICRMAQIMRFHRSFFVIGTCPNRVSLSVCPHRHDINWNWPTQKCRPTRAITHTTLPRSLAYTCTTSICVCSLPNLIPLTIFLYLLV